MVAPALIAELLYDAPCTPDMTAILGEVREALPNTLLGDDGMLIHEDLSVLLDDGNRVPLFTAIQTGPVDAAEYDFSQTWEWSEAAEEASKATARVSLAQVFGHLQPPEARTRAMRAVVGAFVRATGPIATWWPNAQKWVRPEHADGIEGFVNVRLFRVDGRDDELFMDTLGLHALGLPDAEHHFAEMDPADVSSALYDLAAYLMENGDVIGDGHTVGEDAATVRWRCRRASASLDPERAVLALEALD